MCGIVGYIGYNNAKDILLNDENKTKYFDEMLEKSVQIAKANEFVKDGDTVKILEWEFEWYE